MTLVFWQGIISIHQKSFLEAVAAQPAVTKVLLVVAHDITAYRKDMGWDVPAIANVEIVKNPSSIQIKEIVIAYNDAIHIMGGIRVGSMLATALDYCIKERCRLGIMTESYNDAGFKGRLRTVKYRYYGARYFKHIQFVLAIGRQGAKQYASLGFDSTRIFPWAYFISIPLASKTNGLPKVQRIVYAGRIEPAKGIYRFAEELIRTNKDNYTLDIYGTGTDEEKLRHLITANNLQSRIRIYPFQKHDELIKQYGRYDWVALPSAAKDGWGVIVSEGMLNGLKAICSNICGVSRIIKNGKNGVVFDWSKEGDIAQTIEIMLSNNTFTDSTAISTWAQNGISAEAGAAYFTCIMACVYNNETKPGIPWE